MNLHGIEIICACAAHFRSHDDALAKAYGHSASVSNMKFLTDCVTALRNILEKGYSAPRQKLSYNHYLPMFDIGCIQKLQLISDTLLGELRASDASGQKPFLWTICSEENG